MHQPHVARSLFLLLISLLLLGFAAPAPQVPIITLSARSAFDGRFRDSEWMPIIVSVSNTGDAMSGRLVVRPETSGTGITNTYSAPVDLPNGASQTVTLYVAARSFASQIRVELIDNEGVVVAAEPMQIRAIQPTDRLYAVVTASSAGSVDLTGARVGSGAAHQTNWRVEDIPAHASALSSIDLILISDIDTSDLSSTQQAALETWVLSGGHLIVTGGAAWEATAAGLDGLLPFEPDGSDTVATLAGLVEWLRDDEPLEGETVLATGTTHESARLMVEQDGLPLVIRGDYGAGVVDYLTADPNTAPLRGWDGLNDLWTTLATSVEPQPSWASGFTNWDYAAGSVEILPGYNLLPDALPLCGFLGLYIALIGPVNYFVLARLNRRELAWFTIPLFIVIFSAAAYYLGFNLRGTEATISRLSVVQSWSEGDTATVDGLVGLLSPRRAQYDLMLEGGATLRPIPRSTTGTVLTSNVAQSVDMRQTDTFTATDFTVDASFVAGFSASGTIPKPDIGGSASVSTDVATGERRVRGSVSNRTETAIQAPIILARGIAVQLAEVLEPGDTEPFEFVMPPEGLPSPLFNMPASTTGFGMRTYYGAYYGNALQSQTVVDLLGPVEFSPAAIPTAEQEESQRRRLFLGSFINDLYLFTSSSRGMSVSSGRGDNVYLAGWTNAAPLPVNLEGAQWNSTDTTLYLIELDVEFADDGGDVIVTGDQFTWVAEDTGPLGQSAPINLSLQPGDEVTFRFTPLPSAVLDEVDRLTVRLDRASVGSAELPLFLYNWGRDEWEEVQVTNGERTIFSPARFLGPENAVMVRINSDALGGYLRVESLTVEQRGSMAA